MRANKWGAAWAGFGLFLVSGCMSPDQAYFANTESEANVYVAPVTSSIRKLAVLPFKAETELIGGSVSDMFVTELLRAGRYELVERSQMARVLGESELALSGLSDARAAEVASVLGADGVVIGTVDEYGTVAARGHPYPQVGISVRMIDCASGKIMWSADLAKRADSKSAILSSFARKVVHELVAGLYPKWGVQRYDPRAAPLAAAPAAPAAPSPALPPPPPQKPNAFTLSDMGLREVTLSWTEPAARASEYIVERAPAREGPFQTVGRVAASRLSYRDAGSPQAPLADDTLYFYRLSSVSADGQKSDPSTVRESMTAPPPEAPAGVAASASAPRAVKVSWTPAPPEARVGEWKVERSPDDGDSFVSLGSVRKPEFQEGGTKESPLADETAYRYRVRAVNAVGSIGPWCEPVRVETLPPPAPVSCVEAVGGEVRCVPVSWKASADPFVVRYAVYRADGEAGEFRKLADVKGTAYLDGGRNPGSLPDASVFRYRVGAVNTVESEGAPSEICEAKTRPVPPAVTEVKVEGGLPRMTRLAWTASPDEKVIGYNIQRSDLDGDFADIATVDGRATVSYEDRGRARRQALGTLGDGTTYLYRVSAFNTARATGEWSEMADARTKPAPRAPVGVVAESGQPRRIALSWQAAPEPDIAHYEVEWSADGKKFRAAERVVAIGEGGPALVVNELEDSETRHFRIKAVDKDTIESAWSKVQSAMTKPLPPAPAGLKAGAGSVVTWEASAASDVTGYTVWQKGFFRWSVLGAATATEFAIPAALAGKKITVAVTAKDADGLESVRSAPLELSPAKASP